MFAAHRRPAEPLRQSNPRGHRTDSDTPMPQQRLTLARLEQLLLTASDDPHADMDASA